MAASGEKPWYTSTTLWFNMAMMILKGLQAGGVIPVDVLPDSSLLATTAAGNMAIRTFVTSKPLDIRRKTAKALS